MEEPSPHAEARAAPTVRPSAGKCPVQPGPVGGAFVLHEAVAGQGVGAPVDSLALAQGGHHPALVHQPAHGSAYPLLAGGHVPGELFDGPGKPGRPAARLWMAAITSWRARGGGPRCFMAAARPRCGSPSPRRPRRRCYPANRRPPCAMRGGCGVNGWNCWPTSRPMWSRCGRPDKNLDHSS